MLVPIATLLDGVISNSILFHLSLCRKVFRLYYHSYNPRFHLFAFQNSLSIKLRATTLALRLFGSAPAWLPSFLIFSFFVRLKTCTTKASNTRICTTKTRTTKTSINITRAYTTKPRLINTYSA